MTGDTAIQSRREPGGGLRALGEAIICLYIAVILFRTFEVEGYIISTGSMAPSLLGFHKRVVCPSCGFTFALGIAVDTAGAVADTGEQGRAANDKESLPIPFSHDHRG